MPYDVLYKTLGVSNIQNFLFCNIEKQENKIVVELKMKPNTACCSSCKGKNIALRGTVIRRLQTVPIGRSPVQLCVEIPLIECRNCQSIKRAHLPFAENRKQHTRTFARYVIALRKSMTLRDLARHLGVSEWLVRNIEKEYLKRHFDKPRLKDIRLLAIDEICIGKGHRYLTVVIDLESGAALHVGKGKGADALKTLWRRLKAARAKIEAVAIDMSPAYRSAVENNLPEAKIIFDHFHVVKLFNDKLSDFRRDLYRETTDQLQKKVLKGTRWLLLKNPENLEEKKNEQSRLEEALELNKPLATVYYMKEELRQFWSQADKASAVCFFNSWCARAASSGIGMLQRFAKTLRRHYFGLLDWYDFPISTGPLEGTNNKIKTLQRQAYGFRDREYFRLKILSLHETRFKLVC